MGAIVGSVIAALLFIPLEKLFAEDPIDQSASSGDAVDAPLGGAVIKAWEGVDPKLTQYRGDRLEAGQSLSPGDYIASPNLLSALHMTTEGNVVLAVNGTAVWETGTGGLGATGFKVQNDGDLVVLNTEQVLWSPADLPPDQGQASPDAHEPATDPVLIMQDDGNLVAYNDSHRVPGTSWWQSQTRLTGTEPLLVDGDGRPNPPELSAGDQLRAGEYIHNLNRREDGANAPHALRLDEDGNLIIHGAGGNLVWQSLTGGMGIDRLTVQEDGDVVLLTVEDEVKARTGTDGNPGAYLRLNDEGNLVVHQFVDGERLALWARSSDQSRFIVAGQD